jgi:hypothetical protein
VTGLDHYVAAERSAAANLARSITAYEKDVAALAAARVMADA